MLRLDTHSVVQKNHFLFLNKLRGKIGSCFCQLYSEAEMWSVEVAEKKKLNAVTRNMCEIVCMN